MLGVCYFPEHWPDTLWAEDFRRMAELGITVVRMGEFAWSRYEPSRGRFEFEWMDEALSLAQENGLKAVLCTPTATPPKWLTDERPDMLAVDPLTMQVRRHGARRHCDFASRAYGEESRRITEILAKRYGDHEAVAGWQLDNEVGTHGSTHSASEEARLGFQRWCEERHGDIATLNAAWGNAFWSMDYRDFGEIELPFHTPYHANPAHELDYRRFASDAVKTFLEDQITILRPLTPGRFITHNFVPMAASQCDTHACGEKLDFASWDNYPLGFFDVMAPRGLDRQVLKAAMRTGDPDMVSFFFDQCRGVTSEKFWIMEQQPGPVNWAPHNPVPAPGMIRTWSLQAFAHGAECVAYFRWRQVPFAQEQNHAGLLRPDHELSAGGEEAALVADVLKAAALADTPPPAPKVALIADIESQWVTEIDRQSTEYNYNEVAVRWYAALRALGMDVAVLPPGRDLSPYKLVVVPSLPVVKEEALKSFERHDGLLVFGPRSGGKTESFRIPKGLPTGRLKELTGVTVTAVETVRPGTLDAVRYGNESYEARTWRDVVDLGDGVSVEAHFEDGAPALTAKGRVRYAATLPDDALLKRWFGDLMREAGLDPVELGPGLRLARRGAFTVAVNFAPFPQEVPGGVHGKRVVGDDAVEAHGVTIWKTGT